MLVMTPAPYTYIKDRAIHSYAGNIAHVQYIIRGTAYLIRKIGMATSILFLLTLSARLLLALGLFFIETDLGWNVSKRVNRSSGHPGPPAHTIHHDRCAECYVMFT